MPSYLNESNFVQACRTRQGDLRSSICIAYVVGVSDTVNFLQSVGYLSKVYCQSMNVTQGQLAAVFSKYLQDNPAKRHMAAANLVFEALTDAFPCKTDAEKK